MKALRENEGFLMAIFDAAQDGISVQDRELNIVMTNRWLADLFPKDAPLIGKKCYQVYHGYSNPCEQCPSVKAMLTGEKQSKIEPYPNRQNPKKWFHVTACPIKKNDEITGVLEIVTDITDRKSAEDRLREQNLFLHNVLESLPYPFLVINADDYRIEMANSKVGGQEAWENSTCHEITHGKEIPCDCADHCCPLHEIKESGRPCIVEHTHYDKDGRPCSFEVHGYPVFDRDGKLSKMIEYSIDITKRKKAERERERLIAELREALDQVKQLSGLIPICMYCKNIRNDQGYWDQVEQFITKNSSAKLSHGICPDCLAKKHPGVE
jgi:PAS domain S-box-containing protein